MWSSLSRVWEDGGLDDEGPGVCWRCTWPELVARSRMEY